MNRFLSLLAGMMLFCIFSPLVSAQDGYEVKGVVADEVGPIVAATVMEQGTTNGTSTGLDGEFTLSVSGPDAIVEVSCIGYGSVTYAANSIPERIILEEDALFLDDAVVIGYGSLSKKELSSSIVQVDSDQFFKGAMNNPMEMLSGKVAGLNVNTTAAANPNGSSNLQIRGATSISASNSPLIVIDGVVGGDIRNIAAQDIASMTVLKDAASAAIYGTRGANGVILITTRKGSGGETGTARVTYDSYFAVNVAKPHAEVLTADEFRRSRRGNDYGYSTDWYSLIMRDFSYDNNQYLAIDGSTKNGSYNASINYKNATGLDMNSEREEFGGRIAVEQRALDNRLQFNVSLNARRVNETYGEDGLFDTALNMNPTMPVYNEDGTYFQPLSPTGAKNPVAELSLNNNNGQRMYALGTAEIKWNIWSNDVHNISTSASYSLHYNDYKTNYYTPSNAAESFWSGYDGRAEIKYQKWYTNRVEWLFNYSMYLDDHSLQFVGGYSYEDSVWEQVCAGNNDFAYDSLLWHSIGSGSYLDEGLATMYSGKSLSKLVGVFGRVNYNWKDLIMASASIRYEGSTKFGANHKYGAFPSASVAWEMANMPFLRDHRTTVQSLKPRVSYGVTGRSDFDAYQSLATYSANGNNYFFDGEWVTGYQPAVNANPNLGWEKLVSVNVGLDFVLFNSRLRGSIDWFDRSSQDLLYNYNAPQPPFVYSTILVNVGTTHNTGVEVSIEGDVFKGTKVEWTTGINYSYGITKLSTLSNDIYKASYIDLYQKPGVGTTEYFFRIQEGSKVGQFYGYEYAGVDENGDMLIYDNDGNKVSQAVADPSFKRYIGNGTPSHFLSWSNTIRWKNWDLNLFFRGAFGFEIFNMRKYGMGLQGCGTDNVLRTAYTEDAYITTGGGVISSYFLEPGDYFKLENMTLGYNFRPKNSKLINNLRVYLSAKNVFTLTKYSGNDPSIVSVTGLEPGVDVTSAYPTATQLSLGVTLSFN